MPFETNTLMGGQTCIRFSFHHNTEKTAVSGRSYGNYICNVTSVFAPGMQWRPQSAFLAPWAVFVVPPILHPSHSTCSAISLSFMWFVTMHVRNQCAQQPGILKKEWNIKIDPSLPETRPYIKGFYTICPVGK